MSFYDNSSLAFLPSSGAGKDGKAYSIKPTNGTGDFTFSRGSNLAATRVGPTGLIEKGRENLFLYSNQFDTGWPFSNANVTSGQSGYDGSNDAWLLTASLAGGRIQLSRSDTGVNTTSAYFKKGSADGVWLRIDMSGTDANVYVNLIDGSKINSTGEIATKINDVGNGWYRVELTANWINVLNVRIYPTNTSGAVVAGSIYIQDAQLEIGLAATDYIESGATTGKAGLLEDEPRFDYSGGATCPSLLLEPSRTQLMPQSEYFDSYVKSDTSILTNQAQSPEGLVNASLIAETVTNSNHYLGLTSGISVVSGTTYTFSVFIKKGDGASAPDYCQLTFNFAGFGAIYANFNLSNGTIGTSSGVTPLISDSTINGFWRCSITATATSTANTGAIVAFTNNNDSLGRLPSYLGNTASDFYAYGFQVEQGSYPTSYIPNHSGGTITRGADNCSKTGLSSSIGQAEGTLYSEVVFIEDGTQSQWLSISDGTFQNWIFVGKDNDEIRGYVRASNIVAFTNQTFQIVDNAVAKIAIAYKSGDIALYINGTKISSSTNSFSFDNTLDRINFRTNDSGSTLEKARHKKVLVFKERLSDADLATLTTL